MGADEKLGARKTWPTFTWRGAPLLLCEGLVRGGPRTKKPAREAGPLTQKEMWCLGPSGGSGRVQRRVRILDRGPLGPVDKLEVGCVRKRKLKEVSSVPGLSRWKDGGAFY